MNALIVILVVLSIVFIVAAILWPSISGDRVEIERNKTAQAHYQYQIEQEKTTRAWVKGQSVLNWSLALLPFFVIGVIVIVMFGGAYFLRNRPDPAPKPAQIASAPVIHVYYLQSGQQPSKREMYKLLSDAKAKTEQGQDDVIDADWGWK